MKRQIESITIGYGDFDILRADEIGCIIVWTDEFYGEECLHWILIIDRHGKEISRYNPTNVARIIWKE